MKEARIDLRMTKELKVLAKEAAQAEGLSLSSWLTRLITLNTKKV